MASKQPPQLIDVDAADLPAVVGLMLEQRHSNQGGAMAECLRRYFGKPEKAPEKPAALPVKPLQPLQISATTPVPKADSKQLHPDTQASLQMLRLALKVHPEDAAAVSEQLAELIRQS